MCLISAPALSNRRETKRQVETLEYCYRLRAILALCLSLALSGCAGWFPTTAGYEQLLDGWIGSKGEQLVRQWGPPTGEHTDAYGRKIYRFSKHRTYTRSGGTKSQQVLVGGNYVWVDIPQPDRVETTWCDTTFYLDANDTIETYKFVGPDCTAFEKQAD